MNARPERAKKDRAKVDDATWGEDTHVLAQKLEEF